ncbi:gypsy/ty3 retroelement polyprotein [Tanacetum coccineum]
MAKRLGCKIRSTCPLVVSVAEGKDMITVSICKDFQWQLYGQTFTTDVMLIPLGGCDMVLVIQWLSTLGDIKCNFKELKMQFLYNNTKLMLMEDKDQTESRVAPSIQEVLTKYAKFFEDPNKLPPVRSHDHRIPLLPGTQPINIRPYKHLPVQKDDIEAMIRELQLNKHTIKDKFPIPIIEKLIDELGGAVIFSKLDLRSGHHQIRMYKDDIAKTAFKTHESHYEFLVMPFGLTYAPSTFQALMNDLFREFLRKFTMVFFDDILIYNKSLEDHVIHLKVVLSKMKAHGLYAKESKCVFGTTHVEYLGHVISAEGVATDSSKTDASGVGLGAMLQQDGHPIAYLSKDNAVADALSRRGYVGELLIISTTFVSIGFYDRVVQSWLEDDHLQTIIADLKKGEVRKHYVFCNDQLLRKGKLVIGNNDSLRKDLLSYFHDGYIGGHSGVRATTHKTCSIFYWKGLRKQVKQWVKDCLVCQKCKPDLSAYLGFLQPLPIPKTIWSSISMDLIEGLPKSHGYTVIFVVVDRLTKYAHFMPLLHPFTAMQVAQVFLAQFKWLPLAVLWYNSNYHSSIDTTPFEALYGQPPPVHVPYVGELSNVDVVDRSLVAREQAIATLNPIDKFLSGKANRISFLQSILALLSSRSCKDNISSLLNLILPQLNTDGLLDVIPLKVLDMKMVKRNNVMAVYGLVRWSNGDPQDATWKLLEDIYKKYPLFDS